MAARGWPWCRRVAAQPELKATSIDNNVGPPVFTADGKSLLTTVTDDRVVYVEEVPLTGGARSG